MASQTSTRIRLGSVAGTPVWLERSWFFIAAVVTFLAGPTVASFASRPEAISSFASNGVLPARTQLRVILSPRSKTFPTLPKEQLPIIPTVYADERGHFVMEQLTPGEYELMLDALQPFPWTEPQLKLPSMRQFVTINEGETQVTLKLDLASSNGTQKEDKQ